MRAIELLMRSKVATPKSGCFVTSSGAGGDTVTVGST